MQVFLLLVAALVAGYLGGYLALLHARQQDKAELREVVDELLSELRFTAEESCGRLSRERSQLEQLAQTLKEKADMSVHTGHPTYNAPVLASTAQTDMPLKVDPPLWSQVKLLAGQDKSCAQIAKELNIGQGEVELMLNLVHREQPGADYSLS